MSTDHVVHTPPAGHAAGWPTPPTPMPAPLPLDATQRAAAVSAIDFAFMRLAFDRALAMQDAKLALRNDVQDESHREIIAECAAYMVTEGEALLMHLKPRPEPVTDIDPRD